MKKQTVLKLFGSTVNVGNALGVTRMAVSLWGDNIPPLRAYQVERLLEAAKKNNTPLELLRITKSGRIARRLPKGETPKSVERELKRLQCIQQDVERANQDGTDVQQAATAQ